MLAPPVSDETPLEPDHFLTPETTARLQRARAGEDVTRRLQVATLAVGSWGVLEATVVDVGRVRTFTRKRGGDGCLRRVRLSDGTGEVDLVLWGEETHLADAGPLHVRATVRLCGPEVRDGYRGGLELHLGCARIEPVQEDPDAATQEITGELVQVGEGQVVGAPPDTRFKAEVVLHDGADELRMDLWDDALKEVRQLLPGAQVRIVGARAHPDLDGWYLADGAVVTTA